MTTTSSGGAQPRPRGRPAKVTPELGAALIALVREQPALSLDDLVWTIRQRLHVTLSVPTIHRYLAQAGFRRRRPPRSGAAKGAPAPQPVSPVPSAYGYGQAHRDPGDTNRYPCGLTDSEWAQVQHLFAPVGRAGRPEKYPRRQVLDACIYVLRSGCPWRLLPKDFPAWTLVYKTFRRWQARGLFEALYDELRKLWRLRQHRAPDPTAVILDSQSVKSSPQGGPKGYDAGKKVKGRKRHLVTDTLGLLIALLITGADTQDRDAALPTMTLAKIKVPTVQLLYADGGYAGTRAAEIAAHHQIRVEIVRRPARRNVWHEGQLPLFASPPGFVVLPKRWVIERTNAWTDRPRRLNKDHERNPAVSTAWIWLTQARMLLRRMTTVVT